MALSLSLSPFIINSCSISILSAKCRQTDRLQCKQASKQKQTRRRYEPSFIIIIHLHHLFYCKTRGNEFVSRSLKSKTFHDKRWLVVSKVLDVNLFFWGGLKWRFCLKKRGKMDVHHRWSADFG